MKCGHLECETVSRNPNSDDFTSLSCPSSSSTFHSLSSALPTSSTRRFLPSTGNSPKVLSGLRRSPESNLVVLDWYRLGYYLVCFDWVHQECQTVLRALHRTFLRFSSGKNASEIGLDEEDFRNMQRTKSGCIYHQR